MSLLWAIVGESFWPKFCQMIYKLDSKYCSETVQTSIKGLLVSSHLMSLTRTLNELVRRVTLNFNSLYNSLSVLSTRQCRERLFSGETLEVERWSLFFCREHAVWLRLASSNAILCGMHRDAQCSVACISVASFQKFRRFFGSRPEIVLNVVWHPIEHRRLRRPL